MKTGSAKRPPPGQVRKVLSHRMAARYPGARGRGTHVPPAYRAEHERRIAEHMERVARGVES